MFSKPGRAKIGTNASEIVNWAKIRHKAVMLSALQLEVVKNSTIHFISKYLVYFDRQLYKL